MVCLVETEARQRCTPGEKECGCHTWWAGAQSRGSKVIYIRQSFWIFVFLQTNYLVSFSTLDLPWDTSLRSYTHPSVRMDLEVKVSVRSKTHYGLAVSLDFWPTRSLFSHVWCLLCPKSWGVEIPLSFTPTGFCPSLSLPWLLPLGIYKRQTLAIYAVSIVLFISESKQEADCECLNCSRPILCHREY